MCQVCVYSGSLPATKTHKRRAWAFLADVTGEYLGTLTVTQSAELDSYRIEEDTSEPYPGRAFLLCRQDELGDVYRVLVLAPGKAHCTCDGFRRAKHCKHGAAVLAALGVEALVVS